MKRLFLLVTILSFYFSLHVESAQINSSYYDDYCAVLRPNDPNARMELEKGHTYTSADHNDIKSGSIRVSQYGDSLIFSNLVLKNDVSRELGSLLDVNPNSFLFIVLIGENRLETPGFIGISCGEIVIMGEGALIVKAKYFDISAKFEHSVTIDSTTVICKGDWAVSCKGGKVKIYNAHFEGNKITEVSEMVLIGCSIIVPYNGIFDPEEKEKSQIKNSDNVSVSHFIIDTPAPKIDIPSAISLLCAETTILCGHTYTSADISYINSGSISVSEDGRTFTMDNLVLACEKEGNEGNLLYFNTDEQKRFNIVLKGKNKLSTYGYEALYIGSKYQEDAPWEVSVTGEGSLEVSSSLFSLYLKNGKLTVDHTNISAELIAAPSTHIEVKEASIKGSNISWAESLSMENCSIVFPYKGAFSPDYMKYQIRNGYGGIDSHFIIAETDYDSIPSYFDYNNNNLLCGKTYTSADISDIRSGSIRIADDGTSMVFDNLDISQSEGIGFIAYGTGRNFPLQITLIGDNSITTEDFYTMRAKNCTLTLTGDGSLTSIASKYDFGIDDCMFFIDNITLTCGAQRALGNDCSSDVNVKNSTFKGRQILGIKSLTLINCEFNSTNGTHFDITEKVSDQLKDVNGVKISDGFVILPATGDYHNRVCPHDFGKIIVEENQGHTEYVCMHNEGELQVSEISYVLTINGTDLPEQNYTFGNSGTPLRGLLYVPVSFPPSAVAHPVDATITITKVNGAENTSPRKIAKGTVLRGNILPRIVAVEEFASTTCGWCPRGVVSMNLLKQEYGENVIPIVAHVRDPMEAESYTLNTLILPKAMVNRGERIDPYYGSNNSAFGMKEDVRRALCKSTPASITLMATWTDETQTAINAQTVTTFAVDTTVTQYGIAYILLEDGISGTGENWSQNNYYKDDTVDDPNLIPCIDYPTYNAVYDHVVTQAWDVYKGADSFSENVRAGIPCTTDYLCDITDNLLIQDKTRLSLVALLIDRETGEIVNAALSSISDHNSLGIHYITDAQEHPSHIYRIDGSRIATLSKGINIINGKKIIVR